MVTGAQLALRAGPHIPSGLCRQGELMTVGPEVGSHDPAEVLFSSAIWRPVVVGQVEVCDALVEGVAQHFTLNIERAVVAEVVPQAERDRWQDHARMPDAAIDHASVAILRRPPRIQCVWHALVINVHVTNPAWPRQLNGIVPFWERFFVGRPVGCMFPTRQPQLPATPGEICFLTQSARSSWAWVVKCSLATEM